MSAPKLIAHWPLKENAQDAVGQNHGAARNVTFGETAGPGPGGATFDGRDSMIQVPDADALRPGNRDFTIAAWIRCAMPMRGVFGDVLSKFDPTCRCGINLQVAGSSAGYSSMSDARHVHFGVDDGYVGTWEDCGKPWPSNSLISALVAMEGELYAGIADADDPMDATHVFRWTGGTEWADCGRLGDDPNHLSAQSMIVHDGRLYAGTGVWDWRRASGEEFEPALSRVFVYEGGTEWRDLGQVGESVRVLTLASFGGHLYAGLDRVGGGHCFRYDGSQWIDCGAPDDDNLECLMPHAGTLYAATHKNYYRYEGDQRWACFARAPHEITQTHALQTMGGKLWAGTWPQGYVLRYEGGEDWVNTGRLGIPEGLSEINEINDLVVHNGKLYAGVIPKAQVWRYESDGHWTLMASLASRPDYAEAEIHSWCRVPTFASFRGRLFAATGACVSRAVDVDPDGTLGRVYAIDLGQGVSHDHDIGGEWTHIAAVRRGNELRLYVNGERAASSQAPPGRTLDLTNTQPLTIGFGAQGYFAGMIGDVRVYEGVLAAREVRKISGAAGR